MADLLFVAVIIGFFALCLLLVKACDRIIGPDELSASGAATGADEPAVPEVAAR